MIPVIHSSQYPEKWAVPECQPATSRAPSYAELETKRLCIYTGSSCTKIASNHLSFTSRSSNDISRRKSDIRCRLLRVRLNAKSDEISSEGALACVTTMDTKGATKLTEAREEGFGMP